MCIVTGIHSSMPLIVIFPFLFCSIICVVFVAVFISIRAGEHFADDASRNATNIVVRATTMAATEIALFPSTPQGAITCMSYCGLCFLCHFQLFSLEKELHKPKRWKLNLIVVVSMLVAYIIYNVVAFAGYLQVSWSELLCNVFTH